MELAIAMVCPLPTRAIISLTIFRITPPPSLAISNKHVPVLALVYNCGREDAISNSSSSQSKMENTDSNGK